MCALFYCTPQRLSKIDGTVQTSTTETTPSLTQKTEPPPKAIIEKRRFVDFAQLQGDDRKQILHMPFKKRPVIIMPGDQLEITLYEKLPVSQEKRQELKLVDDNGEVLIYPLGRLQLAGSTLAEARSGIEKKMDEYIVTPFCEVAVVKSAYEPRVYVFGEAMKPGVFPVSASSGERLLDMISLAGGTTPRAYQTSIKIVRLYGDSIGVMSVNLDDVLKRGHMEHNLLMQDQDVIYIPTRLLSSVLEVLSALGTVLPWYYFVKNF